MENNSIESYHQAQRAQLFTNDRHPGTAIQLGLTPTHHPAVQGVNETALLRSYPASAAGKTFTGLNYYTIPESEKLTKMRQRKQVKTNRKEKKNVKAVTTTQGDLEEYNIDNVLQELGESEETNKKGVKGPKKAKAERKRSNKNKKSSDVKNDDKSVSPSSSEDEDEEDEEEEEDEHDEELIEPSAAVSLNRQASRSTEDLFTPVIKKHKWKVKKNSTKDDSGHTYSSSSSSSASSTTSSSAVASSMHTSYSALSAKPKYNLRRKSALRPSQSFDTMKSTASSLASDDTLEAAASAKDHLDLATDFPPLSSTDSATDGFVPKWVIKTNQTGGGNGNVSDSNTNNFSSSSNSAVIEDADASDQPLKQPPPDVTVVLQQPASKQCTPGLPDIAAQAPLVMNTTNSSSGVSSNAGDLTPPQTMMSEPSFFPTLDEQSFQAKRSSPAVVMFNSPSEDCLASLNNDNPMLAEQEEGANIEFGFEVNVLDFIVNQVNDDDEAIVSFGKKQFVNSPESGIASSEIINDQSINNEEMEVQEDEEILDDDQQDNNNKEAVKHKFPNYAQVVQYVAASWKKVERELKQGLAQKY